MLRRGFGQLGTYSFLRIPATNSFQHVSKLFPLRRCESTAIERVFRPSKQQLAVVQAVEKHNVMVMARPGAGKTATAEAVVAAFPDVPVAIVTYSKRLQLETMERLATYPNAEVFTFHGLAGHLFGRTVMNDIALQQIRRSSTPPVRTPAYEIIVLDELQDLTPHLYWLTCVLISTITRRNGRAPRIINLGDPRQAIYEFRGADARYLSLSEATFSDLSPYSWQNIQLERSFRLSHETASFVNAFIGEQYIEGSHSGPKPIYLHADIHNVKELLKTIVPLIQKYGPERSAIIAPSVRTSQSLKLLTNALSEVYRIPVAVSIWDDGPLDAEVLYGKVAVATHHQFKGSERDLVIVWGVDDGYFQFIGRDLPDDRCPNAVFVAITRAINQLVVVHSHQNAAMPFMSWQAMERTANFVNLTTEDPKPQNQPGSPLQTGLLLPRKVDVTDLARHVDHETIEELVKRYLHIEKLTSPSPESRCINVVDKVLTNATKKHHEAVSDLNGIAVTAAFEWEVMGACTTYHKKPEELHEIPADATERARWFAKEAAIYEARKSGYRSRYVQMKEHTFDWLDGHLDAATRRLGDEFKDLSRIKFEVELKSKFMVEEKGNQVKPLQETAIHGRVDILLNAPTRSQPAAIWEIKLVSMLNLEHVVQVAVYGYLYYDKVPTGRRENTPFPELWLFNVRDGEKWKITTDMSKVYALVEGLLRAKYTSKGEVPTPRFLKKCEKIRKEVEDASI